MDNEQYLKLQKLEKIQRANKIISQYHTDGAQVRADSYMNMLNKYGTERDNSMHYIYQRDAYDLDTQLTANYEGNGLFAKIIDRPAEEALKHGFDLDIKDQDIEKYLANKLDTLDWEQNAALAIKWARLYGGSVIVMLVNDGGGLEEPLNWNNVQSIDELRVYDRTCVHPDYNSVYKYKPGVRGSKFGMPQYYDISSIYGCFRVHESRCLTFRNNILPEKTMNSEYRFWGLPEYHRIKKQLQSTVTSHGNGERLLERCCQAIYKMKGLSSTLSTDEGEDKVLKRMQIIDMARGILNSMVIDADGEDYDFKQMQLSGVKDILDATCNMLSAVTDIPQTILFGRSPAGMNSTGEGDMESWYNLVEKIQKTQMKANARVLIDLIMLEGVISGKINDIPEYKVGFEKLWSLTDKEQAELDKLKADTELVKAQTSQIYIDEQVIDANEVRKGLQDSNEFQIEDLLDEDDMINFGTDDESIDKLIQDIENGVDVSLPPDNTVPTHDMSNSDSADGGDDDLPEGVGVLTVKDGKVLIGKRLDNGLWCGPGGHMKAGETPEESAAREAYEEFHIKPLTLIPIDIKNGSLRSLQGSTQFLCTEYDGEPKTDEVEMSQPRFVSMEELEGYPLFEPFKEAVQQIMETLNNIDDSG